MASAITQHKQRIEVPVHLFFQSVAAKRVCEFDERLEVSFDNGLVVSRDRPGVFNHDRRRGRGWRGWGRGSLGRS